MIFLGLKEEESFTPSSNIEPIEDKDYNNEHNERALFKCAQCTKILRVYYRGDTQRIFAPKTKFDPFKKNFSIPWINVCKRP